MKSPAGGLVEPFLSYSYSRLLVLELELELEQEQAHMRRFVTLCVALRVRVECAIITLYHIRVAAGFYTALVKKKEAE